MPEPTDFIANLAAAMIREPMREKILLAPSRRTGRQWLDRAAMATGGFINVRVSTMRRLMLDLAEPVLKRRGLRPPSQAETLAAVGKALAATAGTTGRAGYFSSLEPSLSLVEILAASLRDLEMAGIADPEALRRAALNRSKGNELADLALAAAGLRRQAGLAGASDIHGAALARLADIGRSAPLLLMPSASLPDLTAQEKIIWRRWPDAAKTIIQANASACRAEKAAFTAEHAADEARELFRLLQEWETPYDRVEVVCLDSDAAIPALCAAGLDLFGGRPEDLPLTFNNGLPGRGTRPARLLVAWLDWLEQGLPPEGLARMVEADLLAVNGVRRQADAVASRLRALPLTGDPGEYRRRLTARRDGDPIAAALFGLWRAVNDIVPKTGGGGSQRENNAALLECAETLLRLTASGDGKLDAYARSGLVDALTPWRANADWPGFDAAEWLRRTIDRLHVMGLGPLPGRMHVSDLMNGGHSGRECTFVIGMDDSRFPGSVRQDPALLDRERALLSPSLALSSENRRKREKALDSLLSGIRGKVVFSFSHRDHASGREQFPSIAFTKLMRGLPGRPVAALVPDKREQALCGRDDWLSALCAKEGNAVAPAAIAPWFPHLADGARAAAARLEAEFGRFDGHVPEAAAEFAEDNPDAVVSPTDMETLAACPYEFFLRRVLRIKPPERYAPETGRWLPGNVRGSLLHDAFQRFIAIAGERNILVAPAAMSDAAELLDEIVESELAAYRRDFPPPDSLAAGREEREIRRAAEIFLAAEVERRAVGRPVCSEMAIGVKAYGPGSSWDRDEPVRLEVTPGQTMRFRGRIDRVDRLDDNGGLVIFDYKTGRSDMYRFSDPFRRGRNLQPLLYTHMLEQALRERGRPEPVRRFAYFFPMPRDEGRTVSYERSSLGRDGMEIVSVLLDMVRAGYFPFSVDAGDVAFSDYSAIYGNAGDLAVRTREKILSGANPELSAWAALRGV